MSRGTRATPGGSSLRKVVRRAAGRPIVMGDSGTVPIPFRCFKGFANFASTACYEVRRKKEPLGPCADPRMLATLTALYNFRRGRSPRRYLRKVVSARMSSTRTNNSFFLGAVAAVVVALVALVAALLLLAYNANPAQAAGDCSTTSGTTTCTYGSTGAEDTFVVPAGVSTRRRLCQRRFRRRGGLLSSQWR